MKKYSLIIVTALFANLLLANPDSLKTEDSTKDIREIFPFQISFLPGMGTNGLESGNYSNYLSLNVIAGYNGGLEGLEVGGFSNTIKNDVQGIQLAGFSNQVLGKTDGIQAAGFSNLSKSNTNAIQLAGFANTTLANTNGLQLAGFSNVSKGNFNGIQGSGFSNVITGDAMAIQGSGFSNVVTGSLLGLQISGFNNTVTDSLEGIQASGFVNVSKEKLHGAQFAGFVNAAKSIDGYQLSGFVNAAKDVNGTQIGFINAASRYKSGAPIGFLSFVKYGFHNLEISGSETMLGNATFKTGVERFYNILTVGYTPLNNRYAWSYGYGIGSMVRFNRTWALNTDITGNHISYNNKHLNELNLLLKWEVEANYFFGQNFCVFGGASLNGFFTSNYKEDGSDFNDAIIPFKTFEYDDAVVKQIYYPGVNFGIRF